MPLTGRGLWQAELLAEAAASQGRQEEEEMVLDAAREPLFIGIRYEKRGGKSCGRRNAGASLLLVERGFEASSSGP